MARRLARDIAPHVPQVALSSLGGGDAATADDSEQRQSVFHRAQGPAERVCTAQAFACLGRGMILIDGVLVFVLWGGLFGFWAI